MCTRDIFTSKFSLFVAKAQPENPDGQCTKGINTRRKQFHHPQNSLGSEKYSASMQILKGAAACDYSQLLVQSESRPRIAERPNAFAFLLHLFHEVTQLRKMTHSRVSKFSASTHKTLSRHVRECFLA